MTTPTLTTAQQALLVAMYFGQRVRFNHIRHRYERMRADGTIERPLRESVVEALFMNELVYTQQYGIAITDLGRDVARAIIEAE
jgi:hypothetical protein